MAVTVAAGFYFNGGIILCADTQETIEHSKTWTPKLRLEPAAMRGKDSPDDLMLAIAGAGDGPFIDKLTERAWESIFDAQSFDEACSSVEESIKSTHEEYGHIFQPGYLPYVEIVYGIKMQGKSKLFRAYGPIVNEQKGYTAIGKGYYMANFLASKMHQRYLSGSQAVLLAAYILFQCQEHVDGCGGDSHIAILNETGNSHLSNPWKIDFATGQLADVDNKVSTILLSAPDYTMSNENFHSTLGHLAEQIMTIRQAGEKFSNKWKDFAEDVNKRIGTGES
jgi:hypothetical protein